MSGPLGIPGIQNLAQRISQLERLARPAALSTPVPTGGVLGTPSTGGQVSAMSFDQTLASATTPATAKVMDFAQSKVGTQYAAVNPFRFGDVPWDGKAHLSVLGTGTVYQYPAGTYVFDCSGYATSAWRKAGIDLAEYGAATSAGMYANIPRVDRSQAVAGDLVILDTDGDGRPNHVGILDGTGMMYDASPNGGVQRRDINWDRAMAVVRPSLLPAR